MMRGLAKAASNLRDMPVIKVGDGAKFCIVIIDRNRHFTLIQAAEDAIEMCEIISQNHKTTLVTGGVQDLLIPTAVMLFGLKYDL
jgi:hypothetical protein